MNLPVTCGVCGMDITGFFTFTSKPDGGTNVDGRGLLAYCDYFGDGRVHPPEDFPAPTPIRNYGNRMTRDDVVLHQCGSWVK